MTDPAGELVLEAPRAPPRVAVLGLAGPSARDAAGILAHLLPVYDMDDVEHAVGALMPGYSLAEDAPQVRMHWLRHILYGVESADRTVMVVVSGIQMPAESEYIRSLGHHSWVYYMCSDLEAWTYIRYCDALMPVVPMTCNVQGVWEMLCNLVADTRARALGQAGALA